jgi:hypothetical protein
MKGKKFLIVHLEANGDCLMVTAIARQIKHDYPGSRVIWMISEKCKQVIAHNPFVDEIRIFAYTKEEPVVALWTRLKQETERQKQQGLYDEIFYTQIHTDNLYHYDGTTRTSTFRAYPHKITVPVSPSLVLTEEETQRVKIFAEKHKLASYKKVLLVECAPSSGQSKFNMEIALHVGTALVEQDPEMVYIMSTHIAFQSPHARIIDGSVLTFRENAELSKYCTFLLGCSSGITWLLTSEWAKKIPSLQILNPEARFFQFASVKYDFEYWKLDHHHIIESTDAEAHHIIKMVITAIKDFPQAYKLYNENLAPNIDALLYNIEFLLGQKKVKQAFLTFLYFSERNKNKLKILYNVSRHLVRLTMKKVAK